MRGIRKAEFNQESINEQERDLHFHIPSWRALLIDIIPKHVAPQDVLGCHGDEKQDDEESCNAHRKVDKNGAKEAWLDGKQEQEHEVGRQPKPCQDAQLGPFDAHWR